MQAQSHSGGFTIRTKLHGKEIFKGPSAKGNKQLIKLLYGMEFTSEAPSVVYILSSLDDGYIYPY